MKRFLLGFLLASLLISSAIIYYAFPTRSISEIRRGFQEENKALLNEYINFEKIRASLVVQLKNRAGENTENKFLKSIIKGVSGFALEKVADLYITPEKILELSKSSEIKNEEQAQNKPFDGRSQFHSHREYSIFIKDEKQNETQFVFHRYDFNWILEEIILSHN